MCKSDKFSIIEGILFTMGEPCEIERIAYAIDLDIKDTQTLMQEFMDEYNQKKAGMCIIQVENSYQMVTNPNIFEYLIKVVKKPKRFQLTTSTLETLSIVAYKQPVTKSDIEKIRGVNSDYVVSKLLEYGLIQESGRSESVGRPILFTTTKKFLRIFGIKNLDELKNYINIKNEDENDIKEYIEL